MGRPAWQIKMITLFWPVRNLLARMAGWPLVARWVGRTFRGDRASYVPVGAEIEIPESVPLPGKWVEKLIEESSFRFIFKRCLCRSLTRCQHYPHEVGCLFLGEGAREISPSLGKEATVEEALAHHRKARKSGLVPMMGRLRWDSIWLGVSRAAELLTICHCCECCCYFKVYRYLPPDAAGGLQKLEGLEIRIGEGCDGCGVCVERCFIGAMFMKDGRAAVGPACRGCGRCVVFCPPKAIEIILPPADVMENFMGEIKLRAKSKEL